jgi:ubiquinone/menaquinone biosynthesis C-methylase UbiE
MPVTNPTQRFSSRVENYVRYRPGYPSEVLTLLKQECGLTSESVIADIAFGTGIFTRMLAENGNRVFGVEPNAEMRRAGERFLGGYSGFTSIAGTAEATTLADHSVNIITAAQAAHWFDREKARHEFIRILKPGGWIVLIWNDRRLNSTEFQRQYEQLLRTYGTDYEDVRQRGMTLAIEGFFAQSFQTREFEYKQTFDYAGIEGRLLSSSYVPQKDHLQYDPMLRELRRIFDDHQLNGQVSFDYDTRVHYGQLKET